MKVNELSIRISATSDTIWRWTVTGRGEGDENNHHLRGYEESYQAAFEAASKQAQRFNQEKK